MHWLMAYFVELHNDIKLHCEQPTMVLSTNILVEYMYCILVWYIGRNFVVLERYNWPSDRGWLHISDWAVRSLGNPHTAFVIPLHAFWALHHIFLYKAIWIPWHLTCAVNLKQAQNLWWLCEDSIIIVKSKYWDRLACT